MSLDVYCNRISPFYTSICEEFTLIRDRALKPPETSEELMEMVKFTQEARTSGMVKLNERIKESKDRLAYLIDVYMFPAEDIELNCEVLTWPNRISPVFDDNDEVCVLFSLLSHLFLFKAWIAMIIKSYFVLWIMSTEKVWPKFYQKEK